MQESTLDTNSMVPPDPAGSSSVTESGGVVGTNRSASGIPRTVSSNLLVADSLLLGLTFHRMLPVVHSDGRSTVRAIVLYAVALVPVTLAPTLMGMAGWTYFGGALLLGLGLLWISLRMWTMKLAPVASESKPRARQLLQATVLYLPLLFALMMLNHAA